MKRLQHILLISVVVLAASCTKHIPDPGHPDSPSSSRSYIFFEPEVIETVNTRTYMVGGTSLPLANRTAFGVLGYLGSDAIFTDYDNGIAEVYRNGEGVAAPFTYSHIAAWTNSTSVYSFYAFYPYSLVNNVGVTDQVPYISYTQPEDLSQLKDILTATLNTSKVPIVSLNFQHRLWALDLIVLNTRTQKDSIYNSSTPGGYDVYDPVLKVKSVKFEFDDLPKSGTIRLDGVTVSDEVTQTNKFSFDRTYKYDNKTLVSGEKLTLNGSDSFLFLPCMQFKYRLTVELANENLGMSYISHHPSTFEADAEGNPVLANGQIQWDWATASGPDKDDNGTGDGFEAGKRYTLEINKSDYEVTYQWVQADWGMWDEEEEDWIVTDVTHTFN